ncbi:DUF4386 domain-containing protein [Alteromonas sp. 009811495]|uniref:DUF4386 domain-containing protein n=1 Tax=Alteromonas sp. 009811495 TaxID=3002962 RepID=UPI00237DF344|nr:DUF4386 domain-containing protein [Alteromonas sp. 009811495]WDT87410.1 DUF4386 domain-containing protein [Alteromonas sp. 009811495]
MIKKQNEKRMFLTSGVGYFFIFFLAIYANFFVIEAIKNAPLEVVFSQSNIVERGIAALMLTILFDVIIACTLYTLFKRNSLTIASTLFRLIHALFLAVATVSLVNSLSFHSEGLILDGINRFNSIWMLGLAFFGIHLILLSMIVPAPTSIRSFLFFGGSAYLIDTILHLTFSAYSDYAFSLLLFVAIPTVVGEFSLAVWFIKQGTQLKVAQ